MSELTIYCGSLVAYEQPSYYERKSGAMAVTVTGANIGKIVEEIGTDEILDCIDDEAIAAYLERFGWVVVEAGGEQIEGGE